MRRLAGAWDGDGAGTLAFAIAVLASAVALLHWLSRLTFWRDEWAFLLDRRDWDLDTFFGPFLEQLLAIPILIYKLGLELFGMESGAPFQVVSTLVFLTSIVLAFLYARRRVGAWLALALVLPILFFGPSWDDLLFPFQVSFFGSVACGVGAFLALDRGDRRGDVLAACLLTISLFFSDVGIPFVVGVFVEIALDSRRFRRAFVFVVPTALWGLWYLIWGHEATTFVSLHNAATLIGYVPDGFASSLSSWLGIATPRDEMAITPLDWGRPLLVIAAALVVWRLVWIASVPPRFLAVLAVPTVFWTLTGLNATFFGQATSGRYQYIGVVGLVLIASELLRGVRLGRPALAAVLLVSLAATASNGLLLRNTAHGLANFAEQQRGGLAALELGADEMDPGFVLTEENSGVDYLGIVDVASYLSAVGEYGSPAYDAAELPGAPEIARGAADRVFVAGYELALERTPATGPDDCAQLKGGPAPAPSPLAPAVAAPAAAVPGGGALLRARGGDVEIGLRRYGTLSSVRVGRLASGDAGLLEIPPDSSTEPWELEAVGRGSVLICERSTP